MLAVVFKWTPGMEGYLRAMSVPIWTVLIFYLGKSGMGCLTSKNRDTATEGGGGGDGQKCTN